MELSRLTAYAEERYHIAEEYLWKDFPGFSVMRHPQTGKWVALLMREWDGETGVRREWCDIRGGSMGSGDAPYLGPPFRMKGPKWTGVTMGPDTVPEKVFRLFDRAVEGSPAYGYTVVLDDGPSSGRLRDPAGLAVSGSGIYRGFDELRKASENRPDGPDRTPSAESRRAGETVYRDTLIPPVRREEILRRSAPQDDRKGGSALWDDRKGGSALWDDRKGGSAPQDDRRGGFAAREGGVRPDLPYESGIVSGWAAASADASRRERLREMIRLGRHYGLVTYEEKCRTFLRQARFMEDYEDDAPWEGEIVRYFLTYGEMSTRELRGYFTWRTQVRRGEYRHTGAAFVRLYLFELISGVGVSSSADTLRRMKELENRYPFAGEADEKLRRNLSDWMLEFAVMKGFPAETVREFAPRRLMEADGALAVLKDPRDHTDEEVLAAILRFPAGKLPDSPVLASAEGPRLVARVWREAAGGRLRDGRTVFEACFGKPVPLPWYPLSDVLCEVRPASTDCVCELSPFRRYECRKGAWRQVRIQPLMFDKDRFAALFHEADRQLRKYLKTGRALKEKPEEAWAAPFAETVIRLDREEKEEAAKPVIRIDLAGLEKIRLEAAVTRESLLTEEDLENGPAREPAPAAETAGTQAAAEDSAPGIRPAEDIPAFPGTPGGAPEGGGLLTPLQAEILRTLLRGESAEGLIAGHRLFAEVAADEINEALFGELGDSAVECDGRGLTLVEDYREDIARILEEET